MSLIYDYVIMGAGIYGMYAAKIASEKDNHTLIIECDDKPFSRASFINQARVHNGYHYPRSYSTAIKSAKYFDRFCNDFDFAINRRFRKIYAISGKYSLTSGDRFKKFCQYARIPCDEINPDRYFEKNTVQAAFETLEYSFDAEKICHYLENILRESGRVDFKYGTRIVSVDRDEQTYRLHLDNGVTISAYNVINCTYAAINQVNKMFGLEKVLISVGRESSISDASRMGLIANSDR